MRINSVALENFRNYKKRTFKFADGVTIVVGPNGVGKTNLLEAISLLSIGKSSRAVLERDMIYSNAQYARVVGIYSNDNKVEVVLQKQENSSRIKKMFKINRSVKPMSQFVGNSHTVLFAPEDIRLVAGSPMRRREYLNRLIGQVNRRYYSSLLKYNRVLRHRNKLLEQIHGQVLHSVHESQLAVWDSQLLDTGEIIQAVRMDFFDYVKNHIADFSKWLYKGVFELELKYNPSKLSKETLENTKRRELLYGTTQVGPHRDDYEFLLVKRGSKGSTSRMKLKNFGSRGQQRTGVLCMKLLEMKYVEKVSKQKPALLLDDIFSELDKDYRSAISTVIDSQQTVITTSDIKSVPTKIENNATIITL